MSASGIHYQLMSAAAVDELATRPVGKLRPVPIQQAEPAPFTAFDCFDQSLRRSGRLLLETGKAYELLSDGAASLAQTVKGKPRFVADFPDGPLRRALSTISPLRSLLPIGSGERQQATLAFVDDDGKTHCRLSLLRLETPDGHAASLLELQEIKGYGKSLQLLRAHIEQLGGIPASCDILYSQLFPAQAAYDPKPAIFISGDETAFDAANKIIAGGLPVLSANEFGIIADHDTEFLHDYRVQLRKIRSVLSLFKGVYDDAQTAELKTRFSALAKPTGQLRDLDVYLLKKQEYRALLPESLHPGLDALFERFIRQRTTEKARLSRHLSSAPYKREIAALKKLYARPKGLKPGIHAGRMAHEYAAERIWRQFRKVNKAAVAIGPDTPDAEIHELRIHCKKLRYLIEFFAPLFPRPVLKRVLKPLKGLQEHLGLFNDYSVQQESLQAFLPKPGSRQDTGGLELAQSVGALIAVLHGRQLDERDAIMASLERFNRPKTRQTFSELFQPGKDDT